MKSLKSRAPEVVLALFFSLLIPLAPAQASGSDFDADFKPLDFYVGQENIKGVTGSVLIQNDGQSSQPDIGEENMSISDYVVYQSITTSGLTILDAKVEVTNLSGIETGGDNGIEGIEKLDDATSAAGKNRFINLDLEFIAETGREFAELEFSFFNQADSSSVTISNFALSIYDIDSYQFVEVESSFSYQLAPGTILSASNIAGGMKFQSGITATGDDEERTIARVTLLFNSASTFKIRLGQDHPGSKKSAGFELDFSLGQDWDGLTPVTRDPVALPSVSFNANGGSGSMGNQSSGNDAPLNANSFTRDGFTFNGWNTAADGTGTPYADGATFGFSSNTTLYAQWQAVAAPAPTPVEQSPRPYTGPIPSGLSVACVPPDTSSVVELRGIRMNSLLAGVVQGKTVGVTVIDTERVQLQIPALEPGSYDVEYSTNGQGRLIHGNGIVVCARPVPVPTVSEPISTPQPEPFQVTKRFTNYRGDRGGVVGADLSAIRAFILANPGLTNVKCTGSTSGRPAVRTDAALARARAMNACSIVRQLVPGVETSIAISTGRGVGQFYRAVIISGSGTR
jgi:uncharacterized repeat protein (TIGR02543 family)